MALKSVEGHCVKLNLDKMEHISLYGVCFQLCIIKSILCVSNSVNCDTLVEVTKVTLLPDLQNRQTEHYWRRSPLMFLLEQILL